MVQARNDGPAKAGRRSGEGIYKFMIHIVQCLCQQRHCIMALAYEPGSTAAQENFGSCSDITMTEDNAAAYLRGLVDGLVERHVMNPWCGICRSRTFTYEDAVTRYATMAEAEPELRRLEMEQLNTASFFEAWRN